MRRPARGKAAFAGLVSLAAALAFGAAADSPCAEAPDPDDAGVSILRCGGVIVAAEGSSVRSPAALISAHPRAIQLDAGAIAVSTPSAPFAVLAPQAVVEGEGEWLVVAENGRTLALLWRGTATTRLRAETSERMLSLGDAPAGFELARAERLRLALQRARALR